MADQGPQLNSGNGTQTPRQQAAEATSAATAVAPRVHLNGHARPEAVEGVLTRHQTMAYKPNLPIYTFRDEYWSGPEFYWDVEAMQMHDCISTPLEYVKAPISQMQVKATASSSRVAKFLLDEWTKFKEMWIPVVQESGYSYGWHASEPVYAIERGLLVQNELHDFSARDAQPLVRGNQIVGVQVQNLSSNVRDLPGSDKGFPTKGFWYAHRPRAGRHYGTSQIRGAWKPWRRLTGRDGLEEVMDIGIHRYGTGNVVVKAPMEDVRATNQPPGQNRQSALERGREMAEAVKSGGAIVLPSTFDPNTNQPKWSLEAFQPDMKLNELIAGAEFLEKKCSKGIGFPPELLEAADTGSGFSGRLIPLQGFLMAQQRSAQNLFFAWFTQIGQPLIWWNFGRNAWAKPRVISLLQSYRTASQSLFGQMGQPGMPQQQGMPPQGPPQGLQAAPQMPPGGNGPPLPPQAAMPAGGQPQPGKVPYLGPRGGRGWRDQQGRVHYGAIMSTDSAAMNKAIRASEAAMNGEDAEKHLSILAKSLPDLTPEELDLLAQAIEESLTVEQPENKSARLADFSPSPQVDIRQTVQSAIRDVMMPLLQQMMLMGAKQQTPQPVVQQSPPIISVQTPPIHVPVTVQPQAVNVAPPSVTLSTQLPEHISNEVVETIAQMRDQQQEAATAFSERQDRADTAMQRVLDALSQQTQRTVEAITSMPVPVVNIPPQPPIVVNVPETVVNVSPPEVVVKMPEQQAMEVVPTYDETGKVTKVVKTPIGEQAEPVIEITESQVDIQRPE